MRKTYLDNIRWITVVLVVFYHVIYMFNGVTEYGIIGPFSSFQPQDVYMYIVYPWFMLLLFVVSGMSARYELEAKDNGAFIKSRTRKLLVPSTIGLFVWGWSLGYINMLIGGAFESMSAVPKPILFLIMCVSGTGPLWYIQLLWIFSIVLLLVRRIDHDRLYEVGKKSGVLVLLVLTLVIYGAAQILNTPIILVYRFGIYGAGFFIGYFILSHDEVMERVGKNWIILLCLAIVTGIIFVVSFWGQSYVENSVLQSLRCNIYAWLGTLGVLGFMKRWGDNSNSFTEWMNARSWGLYVFHYLPLAYSAWYIHTLLPQMAPVCVYILVTIITFIVSYLLYELFRRIPFIRWCVLGYKGKDK